MGLTIAALVVAIFALQKTVIGEEIVRTVRYVPNPANLPSAKYGVLHSFVANLPDNVTWNETTINNSDNTKLPSQFKEKNFEFTDMYKFSRKAYGSNIQYEPQAFSNNQADQTQVTTAENYESLSKGFNNVLRFENSNVVTKGNQNEIKFEENYPENNAINLQSAGMNNCNKLNGGEIQLKESENILHLSDSISHEHGSDILYEKITLLPKLHNHAAEHNILLNHNIMTPVPISKTATYSINYLYPINGYNIKNVGNTLFLYETNNKDEEIGESDLDRLPNHSCGCSADSMDTKFKYTTTNEKETDVGRQTFITDESLEVIENVLDIYSKVLDIKEKDTGNTEKDLTSRITIKDIKNLDMSQLKKESSSFQINDEVKGREDMGYIVDSHDNINGKLILQTNGISSNAKEFGIQSTKLNFYDDNTDYFKRYNLDSENVAGYRPYQTYKYFDTDFVPKDYSEIDFSYNNLFAHEADNEGTKITISSEDHVISNHDADIKDSNYEYIPKYSAGIATYEYSDGGRKDQKYEYDVGKYDSIYSGTDKNEIISQYYSEILKQGANEDTQDSGYGHYEYIQPKGEIYNNEYINGGTSSNDYEGYKHYKQEEYISKDDSESPKYYNNAENAIHRFFEKSITIDGTEKLIENDQYTTKYNSEPSGYDHAHLVDYNYSPKIYAKTEEPESGFGAHQQYDYISKTGTSYDGYDRNELLSKYDSKLIESDDSYYISKYGLDSGNYHGYENVLEIKEDGYIVKDYKTPKYFSKDGEKYQGYEQYVERDGPEYRVIDNNEHIFNNNQDIREFDKIYVSKYDGEFGEYNLNDDLTYGTNSYQPLIYQSHKNGYKSYESDFNSQAEVQDLLYSQEQYIPQKENSYKTVVDSHELHVKDVDIHLRNWPVSINKFDPKCFYSVNEEELTKLSDVVKTNINEPYITSNVPYPEREEVEIESYGEKSVMFESSDEENQNYEVTEFPSKLVFNDIKYSYHQPLNYHTNHDIKENYEGDGQTPCIISESLETPFLVDVNKEDEENDEYFAPETKCSHPHGHLKFSLQHNSDKKSCNCFKTELDDNSLAVDNIDGKSYYETLSKPPVISVDTHHSLNCLDSFKIKHPTIVLGSDPVPEIKVNEYYSAEDLDEINSAEDKKM